MRRLYRRLKGIVNRRRLEQDFPDELNSHLAIDMEERIARGDSPENAYYGARQDFGSVPRAVERTRETWGGAGSDRLLQDITYAFRQLKRNPGFLW